MTNHLSASIVVGFGQLMSPSDTTDTTALHPSFLQLENVCKLSTWYGALGTEQNGLSNVTAVHDESKNTIF